MRKLTDEEIVVRAVEKHGDRYGYDRVGERTEDGKIWILCRVHGYFPQNVTKHLSGQGCPYCAGNKKKTTEQFIAEVKRKYPDKKWTFEKTVYVNDRTTVIITCHEVDENGVEHGDFEITPNVLLGRRTVCGCQKCGNQSISRKRMKRFEKFVAEAETVHGIGRYDYSETKYKGANRRLKVICHKKDKNGVEHGEFYRTAWEFIGRKYGCPACNQSRLETETATALDRLSITYEYECGKSILPWLGKLSLDFYLPDYGVAIECQGGQHYFPVRRFGGKKAFNEQIERDQRKARLCEENDVRLFYIRYDENVEEAVTRIITELRNNHADSQRV